VGFLGRKNP